MTPERSLTRADWRQLAAWAVVGLIAYAASIAAPLMMTAGLR